MGVASRWWRVELPYACFGIRFSGARVVEAAPIGRWMIGKQYEEVLRWVQRKHGSMAPIWKEIE